MQKKVLNYFFKNRDILFINNCAHRFVDSKINDYLRPNILKKLKWHKEQNHLTVLISASLDIYIKIYGKKNIILITLKQLN